MENERITKHIIAYILRQRRTLEKHSNVCNESVTGLVPGRMLMMVMMMKVQGVFALRVEVF
jgi:hypothetical protein